MPPGWENVGELAAGASSIVLRVRGKRNRLAALKLGRWRQPDLRARFAHEAGILRALGAPATPDLIEDGVLDGLPYLVMELVAGETLASWMSDPRRAGNVGKIVAVLVQVAQTLALVHRAGFVHRDLKPENVMLGEQGTRILDLGLARRPHDADATAISDVVGTVHYTAPEQIRAGALADQRADLYSFGVIAFELLTGGPPFVGERRAIEYQHCNVKAARVSRTRTVPRDLDDLVAQCMDKQPEARPPSADAIAVRLRTIFEQLRTLPGVGPVSARAADVMHPERVAIVWVDAHASAAATSVIAEHHGHVVRRTADGLIAVFASSELEQPAVAAHNAALELAATHCVIVHVATAVVRFPVDGAVGAYGDAIEAAETWASGPRAIGLTLTDDAARELGQRRRPPRLATERTSPPIAERAPVIAEIIALVQQSRSRLITLSGPVGTGKTEVLEEVAAGLRGFRREVVHVRAWRGFLGEVGDDDAAVAEINPGAESGAAEPAAALTAAASRGAILIIDDVQWLSNAFHRALGRPLPGIRIVASPEPWAADTSAVAHTAFELRPGGGASRDEPDTLPEPPDGGWLAAHVIESVAAELAPTLRACAGLGATFTAGEAAAVVGTSAAANHVDALCHAGLFERRGDLYRFASVELQRAIYDNALPTRALVHERALAHALAHRDEDRVRWLARTAYHATGCASFALALACDAALADEARKRGETAVVAGVLARARRAGVAIVPPALANAVRGDDEP